MTMSHHKHHKQQQALDSLYAIGNVLTIKVTMPQTDWDAVRTEQPAGGVCNFEWASVLGLVDLLLKPSV
jgi:hypothetical protein